MTRRVSAHVVRALIAHSMLRDASAAPECVGGVTLRPHQRTSVARLRTVIAEVGGAMLADPVGLGKTYTALALAADSPGRIVIVVPAALREMWSGALQECRVEASVVTHEALSRGTDPPAAPAFVIVDEAHRFRSPSAARYAALARCCRTARVLLLTATPVHNSRADLAAQLALFLGRRAWQMSERELASYIVRGTARPAGLPRLDGPRFIALPEHDAFIEKLIALPPPVPARDEGLAATLLAYGLVHQWTSSRAALLAALQRRRARSIALRAAIDQGQVPTRAELSAWTLEGDAVQLAFPELVTSSSDASDDPSEIARAIDEHKAALDSLVHALRASLDPDLDRAAAIRRIRHAHPGERMLLFCQYTETATALGNLLAHDGSIATLTARGARIASGRIPRAAVLAQFTPGAAPRGARAENIDVLIATDLLSEGLNLQEASVIVHLDLPWNPARLEQRVGRVHRLGSRHDRVAVYAFAPPASAEQMLRIEQRLAAKLRVAQRTVGVAGTILPSPAGMIAPPASAAEEHSELLAALAAWPQDVPPLAFDISDEPYVAAVDSQVDGWLALAERDGSPTLVGEIEGRVTTDPAALRRLVMGAGGADNAVAEARFRHAIARVGLWLDTQRGAAAIDLAAASSARARRSALARVAQALARAPRHRRAQLAPLADAARIVATAALGEGAERILETLVGSELPDEAWLRSVAAFGELNARSHEQPRPAAPARVRAILILTSTQSAGL